MRKYIWLGRDSLRRTLILPRRVPEGRQAVQRRKLQTGRRRQCTTHAVDQRQSTCLLLLPRDVIDCRLRIVAEDKRAIGLIKRAGSVRRHGKLLLHDLLRLHQRQLWRLKHLAALFALDLPARGRINIHVDIAAMRTLAAPDAPAAELRHPLPFRFFAIPETPFLPSFRPSR